MRRTRNAGHSFWEPRKIVGGILGPLVLLLSREGDVRVVMEE